MALKPKKSNDSFEFSPFGDTFRKPDVYFDQDSRCYNIFGMLVSPELLKQIADGAFHDETLSLKYDSTDRTYIVTRHVGSKK